MPLKDTNNNSPILKENSVDKFEQFKAYYYASLRANEVHDLPLEMKPEMMESSASNYYTPNGSLDDDEYADYATNAPTPIESFESEKIKPSDIKILKSNSSSNNNSSEVDVTDMMKSKPNITQLQVPNLDVANTNKYSKLLFSSPSATVTSNGPSVSVKFYLFIIIFFYKIKTA
jgi:hypothetical protein